MCINHAGIRFLRKSDAILVYRSKSKSLFPRTFISRPDKLMKNVNHDNSTGRQTTKHEPDSYKEPTRNIWSLNSHNITTVRTQSQNLVSIYHPYNQLNYSCGLDSILQWLVLICLESYFYCFLFIFIVYYYKSFLYWGSFL